MTPLVSYRRLNVDENKKKIAAAITAVTRYIQQEEEIIYTQPVSAAAPVPSVKFRPWGISGRQAQMQMRNLMQVKAFHGSKFMR